MFGDRCRHLSIEKTSRPYTEIERDTLTGLYRPKRYGRKIAIVGEYCNDFGKYVRDMHYCPVRYSLTKHTAPEIPLPKKPSMRTSIQETLFPCKSKNR